MKNMFNIVILLGILSLISFGCVTGEYDLAYSGSEADLKGDSNICRDNRDIHFENIVGLGCNEYETVSRYIGVWEASIQGMESSKKYTIEITKHPEDYRINVKTNFGFSRDGKRGRSEIDSDSSIEFALDVKGHIAKLRNHPNNVVKFGDIDIYGINFCTFERETSKIEISAISGNKYVGFTDSVVKKNLVNKIQHINTFKRY